MSTLTTNYQFNKPTVGADSDVWGNDYSTGDPAVDPSPGLNGNWEKVDQLLKAMQDEIDAVKQEAEARKIPVGGLYTSVSDTDPATTLGYGTWVPWGEGRALVGVGNNGEHDWLQGEERGAETHVLTESEMPSHDHGPGTYKTDTEPNHTHTQTTIVASGGGFGAGSGLQGSTGNTGAAGAHNHDVASGRSESVGGDQPHNNVQPSKAAYIWERTA